MGNFLSGLAFGKNVQAMFERVNASGKDVAVVAIFPARGAPIAMLTPVRGVPLVASPLPMRLFALTDFGAREIGVEFEAAFSPSGNDFLDWHFLEMVLPILAQRLIDTRKSSTEDAR